MIAIASDHGGYALKQELLRHLEKQGVEFKDFGCYSEASCDYPVLGATNIFSGSSLCSTSTCV